MLTERGRAVDRDLCGSRIARREISKIRIFFQILRTKSDSHQTSANVSALSKDFYFQSSNEWKKTTVIHCEENILYHRL